MRPTKFYGPELARRLEGGEDQVVDFIDIAIHLSLRLGCYFPDHPDSVRELVWEVARQYREHCERTHHPEPMAIGRFVENYVDRVEAQAVERSVPLRVVWVEQAAHRDGLLLSDFEPLPSGVSRRLRCFDRCCVEDPQAEMCLLLHGKEIGGTRYDRHRHWVSWGPAGESPLHPNRSDAEVVQLNAALAKESGDTDHQDRGHRC